MRPIDGDALEKYLSDAEIEAIRQRKYVFASALNTICGNVRNFPTIEPERKPGKWIDAEWENINSGEKRKGRRCSVCGNGYFRYDVSVNTVSDIPNFCPNYGSDMRGDQDD